MDLAKLIREHGQSVIYMAPFDEIVLYLESYLEPGDLLICMGAGNINEIIFTLKARF